MWKARRAAEQARRERQGPEQQTRHVRQGREQQMRRVSPAGGISSRRATLALALGLLLVGCSNAAGGPAAHRADPSAMSGSRPVHRPADGPWRSWTRTLTAREASGTCGATAHQVVCSTASDGLVGRSSSTGSVSWRVTSSGTGKRNGGLVLATADQRALTSGGRVLRAANLDTGEGAWTHRLPSGHAYFGIGQANGVVFALDAATGAPAHDGGTPTTLAAYRTSDGAPLWHRSVNADPGEVPYGFGGRVYLTEGEKVTARDARTGYVVAASPSGTQCPHLVSAHGFLVCTGSPFSASDTFPPVKRLDPGTLRPLNTVPDQGMKPERGLISGDGILMLYEDSAEDPGAGRWTAYDLTIRKTLWTYDTTTREAALDGGLFVTFTAGNAADRGRLITIDLHAGPRGTGAAAPHLSVPYPQTNASNYPSVTAPAGDADHLVVKSSAHPALRSIPIP